MGVLSMMEDFFLVVFNGTYLSMFAAQGPVQNVTEDEKRRASVPVVVDVSHPHPVGEVLAG